MVRTRRVHKKRKGRREEMDNFSTMATQTVIILLFILMGALVLFHICIAGRAFHKGLWTNSSGERSSNKSGGLSPDDLERLPCYEFKAEGQGMGYRHIASTDCVVCLDIFHEGDQCRILPICGHSFHAECVDSWLMRSTICPICWARVCQSNWEDVLEGGARSEMRENGSVTTGSLDPWTLCSSTSVTARVRMCRRQENCCLKASMLIYSLLCFLPNCCVVANCYVLYYLPFSFIFRSVSCKVQQTKLVMVKLRSFQSQKYV